MINFFKIDGYREYSKCNFLKKNTFRSLNSLRKERFGEANGDFVSDPLISVYKQKIPGNPGLILITKIVFYIILLDLQQL
ncbi:hypothetical protein EGY05_08575 [Chryseobacterium arthrosphaerae]|nr:hypothetical protein EGY05_08575 [Chryseobacterium arthrosphaerae]